MNGSWQEDKIYYILLALTLPIIPLYFLYSNHKHNETLNRILNSNLDLLDYSEAYLSEFFTLTDPDHLGINFLNNKYLYNFFKNFLVLYPTNEFLILELNIHEQRSLMSFFEMVKSSSFQTFSTYPMDKKLFYKLLYYINKKIFQLEI